MCFRAWWEASSESPWVFDDASHLHDLKRPSLFRRDKVPGTKHRQTVRLCLHEPKKVFEGSKGRFFKNAPWQGVGQRPTKGEGKPVSGVRPFRRDEVPARNTDRSSGFAFTHLKKFLRVPRGVFSKTLPWQGVGQRPAKRGRASKRGTPFQAGQSP